MSYLHTKGILHKDLRSKNVFIEKQKKVVITDFSLFNVRRLAKPERWACIKKNYQNNFLFKEVHTSHIRTLVKLFIPRAYSISSPRLTTIAIDRKERCLRIRVSCFPWYNFIKFLKNYLVRVIGLWFSIP